MFKFKKNVLFIYDFLEFYYTYANTLNHIQLKVYMGAIYKNIYVSASNLKQSFVRQKK